LGLLPAETFFAFPLDLSFSFSAAIISRLRLASTRRLEVTLALRTTGDRFLPPPPPLAFFAVVLALLAARSASFRAASASLRVFLVASRSRRRVATASRPAWAAWAASSASASLVAPRGGSRVGSGLSAAPRARSRAATPDF
jgi:hypothetical protein